MFHLLINQVILQLLPIYIKLFQLFLLYILAPVQQKHLLLLLHIFHSIYFFLSLYQLLFHLFLIYFFPLTFPSSLLLLLADFSYNHTVLLLIILTILNYTATIIAKTTAILIKNTIFLLNRRTITRRLGRITNILIIPITTLKFPKVIFITHTILIIIFTKLPPIKIKILNPSLLHQTIKLIILLMDSSRSIFIKKNVL